MAALLPLRAFSAILALLFAAQVVGHKTYQVMIPNGDKVKVNGEPWGAVGHNAPETGGALNPFGSAFKDAGEVWTKTLCFLDSDGDGQVNGEELGDPECIWKMGENGGSPNRTTDISHPGLAKSMHGVSQVADGAGIGSSAASALLMYLMMML